MSISQQTVFVGGMDPNTENVPVKVLDCDTISQVKEKALDTIYRATPYSQRPRKDDLDLGKISCSLHAVETMRCGICDLTCDCCNRMANWSIRQIDPLRRGLDDKNGGRMEETEYVEPLQGTRRSVAQFSLQAIVNLQSIDPLREDGQIAQIRNSKP